MKDTAKKEIDAYNRSLGDTIASISTIDCLAVLSSMTSNARYGKESKDVSSKYSSLVKNVDKCGWGKLPGGKNYFFCYEIPLQSVYIIVLRAHLPFSDRNIIIFLLRAEITWGRPEDCTIPLESARDGKFQSFYARCGTENP